MFNLAKRKEERKSKEKALMEEMKMEAKPKFKELALLVLRQQLIILPLVLFAMIILMLVARVLLFFWGA